MGRKESNQTNKTNYTLSDKHGLSHGMCIYQVMMTLHFLNDAESTQKYIKLRNISKILKSEWTYWADK